MSMGFIFLVAVRGASPRKGTLIPWDAIGTVASLLISACSMIVVLWQTRIARRAARTAQEAATATSIQARATVEQANLLREQLAADLEDQVRRAEPKFVLRPVGDEEWGTLGTSTNGGPFLAISPDAPAPVSQWYKRQTLELQMPEGPGEVMVDVSTVRSPRARIKPLGGVAVARLGFVRFEVLTPYDMDGKQITLEVSSKETSSPERGRSWRTRLNIIV